MPRGCPHRHVPRGLWAHWLWPVLGGLSLLWVLMRVGPKPARAAYPCQRVALPMAGAFLSWLAAVGLWMTARRRAVRLWARAHYGRALLCLIVALAALAAALLPWVGARLLAIPPPPAHEPLGVGRGVHPGRVVWVHAPDATDWAGPDSEQRWYEDAHTNPTVVDRMLSAGLRELAGKPTDREAWEALFRHFNAMHGRGTNGYTPGEKIAIKLNLATCWAGRKTTAPFVDPVTRQKTRYPNHVDVAPQMVLALLRQLVEVVGVAQTNIAVGDTTALWPDAYLEPLRAAFEDVRYFENEGGGPRERAEFSATPLYWSTPAATNQVQDYIPTVFTEATYVINFALLKGHSAGVTLGGKNWYGALIRLPGGHLRKEGWFDYYEMHLSLPNKEYSPGGGQYRAMVDLMGHPDLGGKTLLSLLDGLYSGYYSQGRPYPWKSAPFGTAEQGDWPSSLFLSQDPVALDSVGHDFLFAEWPEIVTGGVNEPGSLQGGQEDYLHEAAQAGAPPSGTFYDPDGDGHPLASLGTHEHWDGPETKRYSRNRGLNQGIELVAVRLPAPELRLGLERQDGRVYLTWDAGLGVCRLERAASLGPESAWETVAEGAFNVSGTNRFPIEPDTSAQFYRLLRPGGPREAR